MSRSQSRARKRRARAAELVVEFNRLRQEPEDFRAFLRRLAASNVAVWPIAMTASAEWPLDESEVAMIEKAVAPHLAGNTPGSVTRRHALGATV